MIVQIHTSSKHYAVNYIYSVKLIQVSKFKFNIYQIDIRIHSAVIPIHTSSKHYAVNYVYRKIHTNSKSHI